MLMREQVSRVCTARVSRCQLLSFSRGWHVQAAPQSLHDAAKAGNKEELVRLLEEGRDVNEKGQERDHRPGRGSGVQPHALHPCSAGRRRRRAPDRRARQHCAPLRSRHAPFPHAHAAHLLGTHNFIWSVSLSSWVDMTKGCNGWV